jgi:NAD dependent epimerase/dehydratase family enzyme
LLRVALGEFAQVLLASQRAMPYVLARAGFEFKLPELDRALHDIVRS